MCKIQHTHNSIRFDFFFYLTRVYEINKTFNCIKTQLHTFRVIYEMSHQNNQVEKKKSGSLNYGG